MAAVYTFPGILKSMTTYMKIKERTKVRTSRSPNRGITQKFGQVRKQSTYLSRIGIPDFDELIIGRCDEQPSVHRIPNGGRDGKFVTILVLLVHEQYVPVLCYELGLVFSRVPRIEHSDRAVRCPREQVPPLCQINLTILSDYRHQKTRLTQQRRAHHPNLF
jgi:hypothetical protein